MADENNPTPEDEFEEFEEDFDMSNLFDEDEDAPKEEAAATEEAAEAPPPKEKPEEKAAEAPPPKEELEEKTEEAPDSQAEEAEKEDNEGKESAETPQTEEPAKILSTVEGPSPVNPEEIPINIAVEITRLQIDVRTLMELQPGNMLQLNTTPEQGVNLVSGGKTVAHGELIRVGDLLGVRILEIGR